MAIKKNERIELITWMNVKSIMASVQMLYKEWFLFYDILERAKP